MGWGVRNRQKASRIRVCEWLSGCGRELDRLGGYLLQLSERSSMLSSWEQAIKKVQLTVTQILGPLIRAVCWWEIQI